MDGCKTVYNVTAPLMGLFTGNTSFTILIFL